MDNLLLEHWVPSETRISLRSLCSNGRVRRKLVHDPRLGRSLQWERVTGPGFWLGWCEEIRACQLLLSITRIHNFNAAGYTSNFPLHDFATIDDMNLADTSVAVLGLLGVPCGGLDPVRRLGLPSWIVRRVAYTADVHMEEAEAFIGEVAAVPRKRHTEVHTWGRAGHSAHAAQWEASGVRVQFYKKDLQLRQRLKKLRTGDDALLRAPRTHLEQVAEKARNVVRLEVTLNNLRAIRTALHFEAPATPTFRLMALRATGDYIFGRELSRLRLLGVRGEDVEVEAQVAEDAQDGVGVRARLTEDRARTRSLYDRFIQAQETYNQTDAGRQRPISHSRLRSLFATYMLVGPTATTSS
jgi:hypothetical protein